MGTMSETQQGKGHFSKVILKPWVVIRDSAQIEQAKQLHAKAHEHCFIANSVNFPVRCEPSIETEGSWEKQGNNNY